MCQKVTLDELKQMAANARESIWEQAARCNREPKVYLHWTAGHYGQFYEDYHVNIDEDGSIYVTGDLDEVKAHTWLRNTGAVGITLCCAAGANTSDLGDEPPTEAQIEAMAQAIVAVCDGLWLTIDKYHVLTHGEAADNWDDYDGAYDEDDCYGCQNGCERWDLQYLGIDKSPYFTTDYDEPITGGNVLRGNANFYRSCWNKN